MAEPFLAEIKMVGFNFPPRGWAFCDGQILPINQNQALYSLLGTTYGGDGRTSFGLPDLRGRTPIHKDQGRPLGQKGGVEKVTLDVSELPSHSHAMRANGKAHDQEEPNGMVLGSPSSEGNHYGAAAMLVPMKPTSNAGGGQSHENMQPFTTISFCIALQGLFPSRN